MKFQPIRDSGFRIADSVLLVPACLLFSLLFSACLPPHEVKDMLRAEQVESTMFVFESERDKLEFPGRAVPVQELRGMGPYARVFLEGRLRWEQRNNLYLGAGEPEHDGVLLERLRLTIDSDVNYDIANYFLQLQHSSITDADGPAGTDRNSLDIRQAYLLLGARHARWGVKLGRQELDMGSGRIVGSDWKSNIDHSFDTARLILTDAWNRFEPFEYLWRLDAWVARHVKPEDEKMDIEYDGPLFCGCHYTERRAWPVELSCHLLLHHGMHADEEGEDGSEDWLKLVTAGGSARFRNVIRSFDVEVEGSVQAGEAGPDPHLAAAFATAAGYTLPPAWEPKLGVEYNYASGDHAPTDGNSGSFRRFFPGATYSHLGRLNMCGWQNVQAVGLVVSAKPHKSICIELGTHFLSLDSATDAWYGVNGEELARDPAGSWGRYIGNEFDAVLRWDITKDFRLEVAYSTLAPGRFVRNALGAKHGDLSRFSLEMTLRW